MRMNGRHIGYVVAVARAGSIRAAAKEVGISEAAISAAIKLVEEQVGYTIFIRNLSKGVSPTPQGQKFVGHARALLSHVDTFERAVFDEGEAAGGPIRVGCYAVPAPFIMARLLSALAVSNPRMEIILVEGLLDRVVDDLKSGRTDIAFTYDIFLDSEISYVELFTIRPHIIVSKSSPLAGKKKLSLSEVIALPFALLDLPMSKVEHEFMNIFRLHNLVPNVKYRVKNFELVLSLVAADLAYSFGRLPIKTTAAYDGGGLVQIPIVEDVPIFRMCAAFPNNVSKSRALNAIVEAAASLFAGE